MRRKVEGMGGRRRRKKEKNKKKGKEKRGKERLRSLLCPNI